MLLDSLTQLPISTIILLGVGNFVAWVGVSKAYENYRLKKLGKRPPAVPTWTPLLGIYPQPETSRAWLMRRGGDRIGYHTKFNEEFKE